PIGSQGATQMSLGHGGRQGRGDQHVGPKPEIARSLRVHERQSNQRNQTDPPASEPPRGGGNDEHTESGPQSPLLEPRSRSMVGADNGNEPVARRQIELTRGLHKARIPPRSRHRPASALQSRRSA